MLRFVHQKRLYHYATLGVARTANVKDIRNAFKEQSILCHPDKFPGNATKELAFKKLNAAYQTLSDAKQRAIYDLENPDPKSIPVAQRATFHSGNINELLLNEHGVVQNVRITVQVF